MLDKSPQNKMMTFAPARKEYYFAPTAEYLAEVIYAESIDIAEAAYHKVKRLINQPEVQPEALSTPAPKQDEEEVKS